MTRSDGDPQHGALSTPLRELSKVRRYLRQGRKEQTIEGCRSCINDSLEPLDKVAELMASPAVLMGKLGGSKTAERGPEYFAQIAAMRKNRKGGRPRKKE